MTTPNHPASGHDPAHADTAPTEVPRRNLLYLQVLIGIVLGGALGYLHPTWGSALRPLGDAIPAKAEGQS